MRRRCPLCVALSSLRFLTGDTPGHAFEPAAEAPLNLPPLPLFIRSDERHRLAGAAHAAGPSDPVCEEQICVRQVIVDDLFDALDVQAPGSDIRCNQDWGLAGTEILHHTLAGVLTEVALKRPNGITHVVELFSPAS